MTFNNIKLCILVGLLALSSIFVNAQQPIKYVVFSVTSNVSQYENGKKFPVEKGQIIEEKSILDIPAGGKIQVIDRANKLVLEITGKAKNRLAVLVKTVNSPIGLTGKYLTFLKNGILNRNSDTSMHEQKAGTIYRDDDLLLDVDSITNDILNVDTVLVKELGLVKELSE